jgi:hypothetical protein
VLPDYFVVLSLVIGHLVMRSYYLIYLELNDELSSLIVYFVTRSIFFLGRDQEIDGCCQYMVGITIYSELICSMRLCETCLYYALLRMNAFWIIFMVI